ncbi:MAG TPA: hypothetical protein VFR28_10085 [Allosphingosinicella sp.]|nr:hypothetical protein [Allosphingosinicella sp.]
MIGPIATFLMLASVSGPIQVDVGRANWSNLPPLKAAERVLPSTDMVDKVETMLESGTCKIPGQTAKKFDITIPYAVLVEPDGKARRVVVAETGCAELETFVGVIVTAMAREGDFRPTSEPKARWFASELNFNLQ